MGNMGGFCCCRSRDDSRGMSMTQHMNETFAGNHKTLKITVIGLCADEIGKHLPVWQTAARSGVMRAADVQTYTRHYFHGKHKLLVTLKLVHCENICNNNLVRSQCEGSDRLILVHQAGQKETHNWLVENKQTIGRLVGERCKHNIWVEFDSEQELMVRLQTEIPDEQPFAEEIQEADFVIGPKGVEKFMDTQVKKLANSKLNSDLQH